MLQHPRGGGGGAGAKGDAEITLASRRLEQRGFFQSLRGDRKISSSGRRSDERGRGGLKGVPLFWGVEKLCGGQESAKSIEAIAGLNFLRQIGQTPSKVIEKRNKQRLESRILSLIIVN